MLVYEYMPSVYGIAPHPSNQTGSISGRQPSLPLRSDGPLRSPLRRLVYIQKPRRRTSRLSQKPGTAARGTTSRSIPMSLRRTLRARWSNSTLGTVLLHGFVLAMASSIAWVHRGQYGRGGFWYLAVAPNMCEVDHIADDLFFPAVREAGLVLIDCDNAEPVP